MTPLFKAGDVNHEYYTGHDQPLTAAEADELNRRFAEAKAAADGVYARQSQPPASEWRPIESAPENIVIETKIDDEHGPRNEGLLIRDGNLWWIPDRTIYVYYTPTHWRTPPAGGQDEAE